MVDWKTYSRSSYERWAPNNYNNKPARAKYNEPQPEREEADLKVAVKLFTVRSLNTTYDQPLDSELILCTFFVWGFSFKTKLWREYHVDNLVDVDFHKKSFDRLVLRDDYKTILKAMVAQHFTQGQNRFHDLVAGKGQGLNILLHGLEAWLDSTLTLRCYRSAWSGKDTHSGVHCGSLRTTFILGHLR